MGAFEGFPRVAPALDVPTGTLTFDGPPPPRGHPRFHYAATKVTALGLQSSRKSAWFEGTGPHHSTYLVYAQDNGKATSEPGKPGTDHDVFKLWINGVLRTGRSGRIATGDLRIATH